MSDTVLATIDTGHNAISMEESSQPARHVDGSRTPPDTQYDIMSLHRRGLPVSVIARDLSCDPRTVKAVIENWGNAAHRLRLEAHKAQLVEEYILSWPEARKRGKSDSLLTGLVTLGIVDPPKSTAPTVAVQVNLHGGPEPVSLAKVQVESEGRQNQAEISEGLILGVMSPDPSPQVAENATTYERRLTEDVMPAQAATRVTVLQQGNLENQANKCESQRAGDSRE